MFALNTKASMQVFVSRALIQSLSPGICYSLRLLNLFPSSRFLKGRFPQYLFVCFETGFPGCPGTCYIAEDNLEYRIPHPQ